MSISKLTTELSRPCNELSRRRYILGNDCLPIIARLHGEILSFIDNDLFKKQVGNAKNIYFNISQLMYTPVDDKTSTIIRDDRPYAGLLSLGIGINERNRDQIKNIQILNTKELTLGIIGPASYARQTQNFVHDRFNVYRAQGWKHQLDNEPAIMYMFERKIKSDLQQNSYTPGISKDLIKFYGLKIGNIETSLNAGIEGRYGLNIPNDFGSAPSHPGGKSRVRHQHPVGRPPLYAKPEVHI